MKKKNLMEMDNYYKEAVYYSGEFNRRKEVQEEWNKAHEELCEDIAHANGFESNAEYEMYKREKELRKIRTSASNFLGYLQVGSFEFGDGIPIKIGDEILMEDMDSEKLRIIDVVQNGSAYKFLVGFYLPYVLSTYCYILSNRNSIRGEYKLKCIGMDNYTNFSNYGVSKVKTYVFLMVD